MSTNNASSAASGISAFTTKTMDDLLRELTIFRDLVSQTLAEADSVDGLRRSEEIHTFTKALSEVAKPLVEEPLTEATRKRQERLLIVAAIGLATTQGLLIVEKISGLGIDLKASSTWSIGVLTTVTCSYFLVVFFASYVRDLRAREALHVLPLVHLDLLRKKSYSLYATKLREHLAVAESALTALQKRKDRLDALDLIPESDVMARSAALHTLVQESQAPSLLEQDVAEAKAEVSAISRQIGLAFGIVERTQEIDRLRTLVDLLLPVAIALLSIGMGVVYIRSTW